MTYNKENKGKYEEAIAILEAISFDNGNVNWLYINALSIVKEVITWDGDKEPIFGHGYIHEKGGKIRDLIKEIN